MNEKLEVLISCMHQKNLSIAERTGVRTDTLIINQCPGDCPEAGTLHCVMRRDMSP